MCSRQNTKELDKLSETLVSLVKIFWNNEETRDYNWWRDKGSYIFRSSNDYVAYVSLWDKLIKGIISLNPEMLSEPEVDREMFWEFLVQETTKPSFSKQLDNERLSVDANAILNKLAAFKDSNSVDIPIANLHHKGADIVLGDVKFQVISDADLEKWRNPPMCVDSHGK